MTGPDNSQAAAGPDSPETNMRAWQVVDGHSPGPSVAASCVATTVIPVTDSTGWRDLGFARLDTARPERTGDPEVVYGDGKTAEQTVTLLRALRDEHPDRAVLATRLDPTTRAAVRAAFGDHADIDDVARCATVGPSPEPSGRVLIVAAGTSDLPVATEAAVTARVFGATAEIITDVGVAGVHRLLGVQEELNTADCLIVVAGMEGALPSVVGGLTGVPLVAVPTSVGYGASLGGIAALLAMLNSCAPGVVVVNIDNGFGAGVHAARVARNAAPPTLDGATQTTVERDMQTTPDGSAQATAYRTRQPPARATADHTAQATPRSPAQGATEEEVGQ
jgi:NCAIR mutase (PurE)-related protein